MARELADDALKQLDAALSVTPSPEAVAKVRERVRLEPGASRAFHGWWWVAAAGAAVIAVGIASSIFFASHRASPAPPVVVATNTPPPGDLVVPLANAKRAVVRRAVRAHELEVLVPPDEGIALRKLLLALREGRATVPSLGRATEDADGHLLEPTPIAIPSIKIELLPGTPVGGSGGRVK